jgi:D-psicose/D-tagatose/L-ribulose 3-epimerase
MSAMQLGINLMAWSGRIDLDLLPRIAELGYDGVELPILQPDAVDRAAVRAALERHGLACTASAAIPAGSSLLEPGQRRRGEVWIGRCAEVAAACGASLLCGPLYAPVGALTGRPPTARERASCLTGLRQAARRAADLGVTLALEPLNRFETHFLNTVDDGLRLVEAVDHPAVGLHLDTFHMNVEEKDVAAAIRRASGRVAHVHFSENDRGTVGTGHVDWPGVAEALRAIEYQGWVVAETFTGSVPEIAAATAVWRPLVADPWIYADQSLRFMRGLLART